MMSPKFGHSCDLGNIDSKREPKNEIYNFGIVFIHRHSESKAWSNIT